MQPAPNHLDLSNVAEHRAQETEGRGVAEQQHPEINSPRPAAPLTRREQRVKQLLLKELDRLNGKSWGSGLSEDTYRTKTTLTAAATVALPARPEAAVAVADLLP